MRAMMTIGTIAFVASCAGVPQIPVMPQIPGMPPIPMNMPQPESPLQPPSPPSSDSPPTASRASEYAPPITFFEPPPGDSPMYCQYEVQSGQMRRSILLDEHASRDAVEENEKQTRLAWEACLKQLSDEKSASEKEETLAADRREKEKAWLDQKHAAEAAREKKSQEEQAARQEEKRILDGRMKSLNTPHMAAIAISASICEAKADQAEAKRAIAQEKETARRSGGNFVDPQLIYDHESDFEAAVKNQRTSESLLRSRKVSALSCSDRDVATILMCTTDDSEAVKNRCSAARSKDLTNFYSWFFTPIE